ncbi:MAG TPA: endoribonuclease MazF [archaeon]|nr:endoribonuclease MazF [archaeon]
MEQSYYPDRGDIIWLSYDPKAGHEQAGRRPALVLSPGLYNQKVGLALVCPITTQTKEYPYEVRLPEGMEISGVILSDQIKSLDWKARRAQFIGKVPRNIIEDVLAKIATLLT